MAIWQFEVSFIPSCRLSSVDDSYGFFGNDVDIISCIEAVLPRSESWSNDLLAWGSEDGDRYHAIVRNGRIIELTARVDMRSLNHGMLTSIVKIAEIAKAAVDIGKKTVSQCNIEELSNLAKESLAYKFVTSPGSSLKRINIDNE